MSKPECPDGGTCHHQCPGVERCFRVLSREPLSGAFPGDRWPIAVLLAHVGPTSTPLTAQDYRWALAQSSKPIEAAIAMLDARGEKWDLYRCHDKDWIVNLGGGTPNQRTARGSTIQEALEAAVLSIPLPLVPRRPPEYVNLTVRKEECGKWAIFDGQSRLTGAIQTKTKAHEAAIQLETSSARGLNEWRTKYDSIVSTGREGVDFRWAR
jgi:hypothetical protein